MSALNMLPLYTDAYLADTTHLSLEEHGAYLKLLIVMWRNGGSLPDDDKIVSRYLGCTLAKWSKIKPTLSTFFLYENSSFTQKKLKEIFANQIELVEKNKQNGRKGAEAKHRKNNNTTIGEASNSPEESPPPESGEALANRIPYTVNHTNNTLEGREEEPPAALSVSDFQKVFDYVTTKFPDLMAKNSAAIHAWLEAGYGFDKHIKPVVDAASAKGNTPRGFNFFTPAIEDSAKLKVTPVPKAEPKVELTAEQIQKNKEWKQKMGIYA